jgi:hypothetical protein
MLLKNICVASSNSNVSPSRAVKQLFDDDVEVSSPVEVGGVKVEHFLRQI